MIGFHLIWKSILIVLGGTILLRIAGRKSIAQMTLAQVVIMIGIGSLLVQPIAGKSIWTALSVGFILVITLVIIEWAQLKVNAIETFITGKAKVLIQDGVLQVQTLKKLRLTVDQLEIQLRKAGITSIEDVQYATSEPNGNLGFVLKEEKRPATFGELQAVLQEIRAIRLLLQGNSSYVEQPKSTFESVPLFEEIQDKGHSEPAHTQFK